LAPTIRLGLGADLLTARTMPLATGLGPTEAQLAAGAQLGPGVGGVPPPVGSVEM